VSVVCAPASLKGVLSAEEAARSLAQGVEAAGGDAVELPVADGGEGTAAVLFGALGGDWHEASVHDPLGRPIVARFLVLPDRTAVVEVAEAAGLGLLRREERSPLRATTHGFGELLLAALATEPNALLVGLGGSATVDGGRGMREVVGSSLDDMQIDVACDVTSPLLGPTGAAAVYGPQKGATPEDVIRLEELLADDDELRPYAELAGAGAAGGLGAAFAALGGTLRSGAELVLETLSFRRRVAGSALVVTGEGKVDATTLLGKAPGAVVAQAREAAVPAVLFGGLVEPGVTVDARLVALSGVPSRAARDLVELGRTLAALS
jgi:glycerate kinase